ncbi:hypothetical protein BDZ88DRAFT_432091 [Geranomyces variabilis]|nr:hypothetical protein BDZ88DRAFT_432091 [Geranomyces variabilis]
MHKVATNGRRNGGQPPPPPPVPHKGPRYPSDLPLYMNYLLPAINEFLHRYNLVVDGKYNVPPPTGRWRHPMVPFFPETESESDEPYLVTWWASHCESLRSGSPEMLAALNAGGSSLEGDVYTQRRQQTAPHTREQTQVKEASGPPPRAPSLTASAKRKLSNSKSESISPTKIVKSSEGRQQAASQAYQQQQQQLHAQHMQFQQFQAPVPPPGSGAQFQQFHASGPPGSGRMAAGVPFPYPRPAGPMISHELVAAAKRDFIQAVLASHYPDRDLKGLSQAEFQQAMQVAGKQWEDPSLQSRVITAYRHRHGEVMQQMQHAPPGQHFTQQQQQQAAQMQQMQLQMHQQQQAQAAAAAQMVTPMPADEASLPPVQGDQGVPTHANKRMRGGSARIGGVTGIMQQSPHQTQAQPGQMMANSPQMANGMMAAHQQAMYNMTPELQQQAMLNRRMSSVQQRGVGPNGMIPAQSPQTRPHGVPPGFRMPGMIGTSNTEALIQQQAAAGNKMTAQQVREINHYHQSQLQNLAQRSPQVPGGVIGPYNNALKRKASDVSTGQQDAVPGPSPQQQHQAAQMAQMMEMRRYQSEAAAAAANGQMLGAGHLQGVPGVDPRMVPMYRQNSFLQQQKRAHQQQQLMEAQAQHPIARPHLSNAQHQAMMAQHHAQQQQQVQMQAHMHQNQQQLQHQQHLLQQQMGAPMQLQQQAMQLQSGQMQPAQLPQQMQPQVQPSQLPPQQQAQLQATQQQSQAQQQAMPQAHGKGNAGTFKVPPAKQNGKKANNAAAAQQQASGGGGGGTSTAGPSSVPAPSNKGKPEHGGQATPRQQHSTTGVPPTTPTPAPAPEQQSHPPQQRKQQQATPTAGPSVVPQSQQQQSQSQQQLQQASSQQQQQMQQPPASQPQQQQLQAAPQHQSQLQPQPPQHTTSPPSAEIPSSFTDDGPGSSLSQPPSQGLSFAGLDDLYMGGLVDDLTGFSGEGWGLSVGADEPLLSALVETPPPPAATAPQTLLPAAPAPGSDSTTSPGSSGGVPPGPPSPKLDGQLSEADLDSLLGLCT